MSREMHVPVETDQSQGTMESPAGDDSLQEQAAGVPEAAVPDLVYDLRAGNASSEAFYAVAADFSDKLLAEIDLRAGDAIRRYRHYELEDLKEFPRSVGEYSIELLTLSLALARYSEAAEDAQRWAIQGARGLVWIRRRVTPLKPLADFLRAAVTRRFLMQENWPNAEKDAVGDAKETSGREQSGSRLLSRLPRLIVWFQATGDFEQVALRLNHWLGFLSTMPRTEASRLIETAMELFKWFQSEAESALGTFTRGVPKFLATEYKSRGFREDQIFCGKAPVEYHLNMVAAEIMNRGLRAEFERKPERVVLAPMCMRSNNGLSCQARTSGTDIECSGCTKDCAVNRLKLRMQSFGARVFLVPHSSGFSRSLARWQVEPNTGVAAVACLSNILEGGYEMRTRGIASQCVLLDFPGCQKHWRREAYATDLNTARMVRIVTPARNL